MMSIYRDTRNGSWVVQLQRTLPSGKSVRKCRRVRGDRREAEAVEAALTRELEETVEHHRLQVRREEQRLQAAETLGIDLTSTASAPRPTLGEYLKGRWASHAQAAQNATTRRTTRTHVSYLTLYLGDTPLDRIDAAAVARLREDLLQNGPQSFKLNRDGQLRRRRVATFTNTAINRIMATLAAALNLAERERVIDRAPDVDMLPADNSSTIDPPTDAELAAILKAAKDFRGVAPLMPEAIELAAETGMRGGEQFALTWRSIDFSMGDTGAIRIETQPKVRLVDGKAWTPKKMTFRVIPLSARARALLLSLKKRVPHRPDDRVVPSRGGSPYERLEAAPDKAGKGYYPDVVATAELNHRVTWHSLRHYFAVRALLAGVPIAVVSAWLGHSDINLTVKRYGRWASEAREQWAWVHRMARPAVAPDR